MFDHRTNGKTFTETVVDIHCVTCGPLAVKKHCMHFAEEYCLVVLRLCVTVWNMILHN